LGEVAMRRRRRRKGRAELGLCRAAGCLPRVTVMESV